MAEAKANIVQIVAAHPPYRSGTGTVAFHYAKYLAAHGYAVETLTPQWGDAPDTESSAGATVRRLPTGPGLGLARALRDLVPTAEPDLVHVHAPYPLGAEQGLALARRSGARFVVTYHQDLQHTFPLSVLSSFHNRVMLPRVLRASDLVTVPTLDYVDGSVARAALEAATRLEAVPNGVDVEAFKPARTLDELPPGWSEEDVKNAFLFVGGMDPPHYFKGVDVLLNALTRLNGTRLVLVGDGELRPRYERLARELGIHERVHFAGGVDQDRLVGLYANTRATVLPSTTRGEIFGIVLIEAMAAGRPVVASALPGVRTVVDDEVTGLLVPPRDVDALARALQRMVDREDTDAMGEAGRQRVVDRYSWQAIGQRLAGLYREVLA